MTNAFYNANLIYRQAAQVSFVSHQIAHPLFREYSFRLQNLIRELGDEIEIADWKRFVRRLKRWRFEQLAAPLGFGNPAVMSPTDLEELTEILRRLRSSSSDFVSQAEKIFQILRELITDGGNPMLEKLLLIAENLENLPVVIVESRLIKPTEKVFAEARKSFFRFRSFNKAVVSEKLFVLSESQLRRNVCFEEIACFGASRWHSEYIFTAPRARKIHLLRFDWLRDKLQRNSAFINPLKSANGRGERMKDFDYEPPSAPDFLESADIIPSVNLAEIAEKFAHRNQKYSNDLRESVEARLFWLEGRRGVFLEENSRALVIDLTRQPPVRKRRVAEIASGTFILLRDGGGGDFIVPLADKILGKNAPKLREFQRSWKRNLREAVKENGASKIVGELKNFGAIHANKINLRNWMSERNIETRDPKDFAALMTLVGLEDKLETCVAIAKKIRQAHQKAGSLIRRMLLEKVSETDLSNLEKYGEMKFELAAAGGKIIARRVVRRAESTVEIDAKRLNHRFSLE